MSKWHLTSLRLAYVGLISILPIYALADYNASAGSGLIIRAFDSTHGGTSLCAAASTQCQAVGLVNSAGAEIATAGAPIRIDPTGTTTQPVSGTVAVTNGGTFATQLTGATNNINNISGTITLPTGAATSALQATNTATTAHTCAVAGYSELGCLGQIDDDVKGPIPTGGNVIGFVSNDPCAQATKLGAPISLTASGQIITGAASKKTYICSLDLISATQQNIALVEGTGTTCATNIYGLAGGTTAATGWNLAANGGLTKGAGSGTVYSPSGDINGTAANVCILLSSTGQTSGQITYVQQ